MLGMEQLDSIHADMAARMCDLFVADKIATAQFRKVSDSHMLVSRLRELNGGTTAQQSEVARRLCDIANR